MRTPITQALCIALSVLLFYGCDIRTEAEDLSLGTGELGSDEASQGNDSSYIKTLVMQAFYLSDRNPDSAYLLAHKVLDLSRKAQYEKGLGYAYMRLGAVHHLQGRNDSALYYMRKCFALRKTRGDYAGAIDASHNLSIYYNARGEVDSAYQSLYRALRIGDKLRDSVKFGYTYLELGDLSVQYLALDTAAYFFQEALYIAKRHRDSMLLRDAYSGLGQLYFAQERYQVALDYFLLSDTLIPGKHTVFEANSYNNLAVCYERLGEVQKARSYYTKTLRLQEALGMKNNVVQTTGNIGALYYEAGQLDSAELWFRRVQHLFDSSTALADRIKNTYALAWTLYLQDKSSEAFELYAEYAALKDSLLDTEKISSIAEMQTRYDTEKKEQQIALLDEQNRTKAAQRNALIAGSTVLILGLFTLGFYYRQRVKLAKKDKQIARERIGSLLKEQEARSYTAMLKGQEEERQRIASDLHDRLGSMLSTTKLLLAVADDKADESSEQLQKATTLVDEAVKEVRRVSHNLSTGMVKSFGLARALEDLADSINQTKLIQCRVHVYGLDERLETQLEIDVYRMIQEAVNNALKHADATRLDIQLNHSEAVLSISVEDNGRGFNPNIQHKKAGIGLSNLKNRAEKYGGNCTFDSKPDKGTLVIVELPLKAARYD